METNTANQNDTVYALRYTCQERECYLTGIRGLFWSRHQARKTLRETMAAMAENGYQSTMTSPNNELVCMHSLTDNKELHLYIEPMKIE